MGVGSSRAHHYEIGRLGCDRHAQQGRAWVTIDHCPLDICRAHSSIRDDLQRRLSMHGGVIGQARRAREGRRRGLYGAELPLLLRDGRPNGEPLWSPRSRRIQQ